jgi:2-oxo-4-hydroxy-4-carboxy-5-ureidoimidazoline decarboxylase
MPDEPGRGDVTAAAGEAVWLDALPTDAAREALSRCCGARRWVAGMLERRPFGSSIALRASAREVWSRLERRDYLEAFSHHPPIGGDLAGLRARFASTRAWSAEEQSGVAHADDGTLRDLEEANRAYSARFGYIFIVCASGQSARAMLDALRARLPNDPDTELQIAAGEQAKITELRLDRLGR